MNMFEEVWPGWNLGKSDVGVAKIKEAGGGGGSRRSSASRICMRRAGS